MRLRFLRALVTWGVVLSLGMLVAIFLAVDPTTLSPLGEVLVFGTLFLLSLCSVLSLLLGLGARCLDPIQAEAYQSGAFRQSLLLSLWLLVLLVAEREDWLTWWGVLLSLAFILLVELSYRSLTHLKR